MTADRITLTVAAEGELVEIPLGPNNRMWMRLDAEQAAMVRSKLAELGPGARFVLEPPAEDAEPIVKLMAALGEWRQP